jgi:predicted transport protein
MSDIKLFKINAGTTTELAGSSHGLEKSLQNLFEANLHTLLGVHFLASEHSTGRTHAGRIDTLGIDENDCPAIIEYKRSVSENVINQGLYYLDWLLDHKAEFKLLVMEKLSEDAAERIDWSAPRLICVASDYKKYDEHAVRQINRNIDLIRYKRFGEELMALELATTVSAEATRSTSDSTEKVPKGTSGRTMQEMLDTMSPELREVYDGVCDFMDNLGDDVTRKPLKLYTAFRCIRNFASVTAQKKRLLLHLHLDPTTVDLVDGYSRDVSNIGIWGSGALEVSLEKLSDLKKAEPLMMRAYEEQ